MRKLLPMAMLLMAATLATPATAGTVVPGEPVPDFALKNTAGENTRLAELRGEVVLLSFWAGWCGRCSDQLRELDRLQAQYGPRGLRVVAVNIDGEPGVAREAASRLKVLVLHDADQAVAREYGLANLPMTVLVDPHGKVRYVHENYRGGDVALYDEELAVLLSE